MNYIYKPGLLADIEADIAEGRLSHCVGNTLIRYVMNHQNDVHPVLMDSLGINGADRQIRKLFEEMSELQEAICKHMDDRDTDDHVAEEIADVFIMLQQMIILHDCEDEFDKWYQFKIDRMDKRNRAAIAKIGDFIAAIVEGVHRES